MNWNFFRRSARLVNGRPLLSGMQVRPGLEALEDRTVPTPVVFQEVQSQSPVVLSGSIGGVPFQAQGPGSLLSTNYGTFLTDIDTVNGTINFIGGGNDFCAADTGRWAPLPDGSSGTATGIYGLQADISGTFMGVLRDFHMKADTFGQALPLYSNGDGTLGFPSQETISINAGTGTWAHPTLGHGPINVGGLRGPNLAYDGTIFDNGDGTITLSVPMSLAYNTTIGGQPATLQFDGQILGTAPSPWTGPGRLPPHGPTLGGVIDSLAKIATEQPLAGNPGHGRTPESYPGSLVAPTGVSLQGSQLRFGDPVAHSTHHAQPAAFDQFAVQDVVFQGLP
jgi:hypothetical protein